MKKLVIFIIRLYQKIFSPDKGILRVLYTNKYGHCLMYPTCSEYMVGAVVKYGAIKGVYKGIKRIGRCHPYQKNLIDLP